MIDRERRQARNASESLEVFVAKKAEFDALVADLRRMSADHFSADPEKILWSEAASLADWNARLRQITDAYFRRGEFAI
jgi:hypothetical protein